MRQRDLRQQLPADDVVAIIRRAARCGKRPGKAQRQAAIGTGKPSANGAPRSARERHGAGPRKRQVSGGVHAPDGRTGRRGTPTSGSDRKRRCRTPSAEPADSRGKRTARGGSGAARQAKPVWPFDPDSRFELLKDLKKSFDSLSAKRFLIGTRRLAPAAARGDLGGQARAQMGCGSRATRQPLRWMASEQRSRREALSAARSALRGWRTGK